MKEGNKTTRVLCMIMVMTILMGLMLPGDSAKAASQQKIPEVIHTQYATEFLIVPLKTRDQRVKNIKTNSADAKANVTTIAAEEGSDLYSEIGIVMKKEGAYEVSFDVCSGSGSKVSSHSVKVYYNSEKAVKSISFAGKKSDKYGAIYTKQTKGKLSVEMNKDYKLKKIVVLTYDKNGKEHLKQIKNNNVISLGKYASITKYGKETGSEYNMYRNLLAHTTITVYYVDKYTGEEVQESFTISRAAAKMK